jgi:glycosyltransferase involved in cell wall biosynthesis
MPGTPQDSTPPKISFCIPTFNRAEYLGVTLDNIIDQATTDCEIVVLDAGSSDNTDDVVSARAARFPRLRYVKQAAPSGVDRSIDEVITLSSGDFCWLSSSKDLLKPGAVATVLTLLQEDVSLVAINMEIRDTTSSVLLVPRSVTFEKDGIYEPQDIDRLFTEAFNVVNHMSCLIIRRSLWLVRERARYYGSLYMHLAVIFQEPLPGRAIVVSKPLLCHRFGGQSWLSGATQMELMWSPLIESLAISRSTKKMFARSSALQRFRSLLSYRAFGLYSWSEYLRFIHPNLRSRDSILPALAAVAPGGFLNAIFVLQNKFGSDHYRNITLHMLRASRFHVRNWQILRHTSRAPAGHG